ncbi:MAG: hypothetical protein JKY56_03430 [Kofleriaceae bacterium]|nr:hypothetical protein [Kofleriaceae bacterium]
MQFFEKLADQVENLSGELGFSEAALQALAQARPAEHHSVEEIVSWALLAEKLPRQRDIAASFGDPPITLVHRPNFHIQLLLWREGSAAIHHHAFSGAFSVLRGESLHTRYGFTQVEKVSDGFVTGELHFWDCEYLKVGDVRGIVPGPSMIHSVFHLGQPSATIVVRTHHDPAGSPQLAYTPQLAFDPFVESVELTRKLQLLDMIADKGEKELVSALREIIEVADLVTSFAVLRFYVSRVGHVRKIGSLLEGVSAKHGQVAGVIQNALEDSLREGNIVSRRQILKSPEHRLFLALLLNIPTLAGMLEILRSYSDENPQELIKRWLEEIATIKVDSRWGPSALGVVLNDGALEFLAGIISGSSVEDAQSGCSDARAGAIASLTLTRSSVLRPLFR